MTFVWPLNPKCVHCLKLLVTKFGDHSTLFAEDTVFYRFWQNEVKGHLGVTRGQSVITLY